MLDAVRGLGADDLVICLISGGGSALLPLPGEGVSLDDKQAINRALLKSGATISEMNCVRRHLSAIKGGRLAAACHPARVVNLLISDVPGDNPMDIASGPTVADPTTCADALEIVRRYAIELPAGARWLLESGAGETVKPGDARLAGVATHLIATPQMALEAAADVARAAGVSKWTVIRAFKPGASIAEASRRRVMEIADSLGYRLNLLARSLATQSTQQVAILVDDFANPYKLPFLELLTKKLQNEGMLAILININESFDHPEALIDADQRQIDAAILMGTDFRDEMLIDRDRNIPMPRLLVLARESTIASIPSVSCDGPASIEEIGGYLVRKGYRRPGFMSGPRTLSTALGRRRPFVAFWQRHGLADLPELPAQATIDERTKQLIDEANAEIETLTVEQAIADSEGAGLIELHGRRGGAG